MFNLVLETFFKTLNEDLEVIGNRRVGSDADAGRGSRPAWDSSFGPVAQLVRAHP